MKKNKNLSELMGYAEKHKYLTYASLILSVISAFFALLPFVFIFFIIKEVIEVTPNYSKIAGNMRKILMSHIAKLLLDFVGEMGSGKIHHIVNDSNAATETYLLICLVPVVLGFAAMFKMAYDMKNYQMENCFYIVSPNVSLVKF